MAIKLPCPLQSGYSVRETAGEFLQTTLDGGAPRTRRNIVGAWKAVDCLWIFNSQELAVFEEKYQYFIITGGRPFEIPLVLNGPVETRTAVFVPETKRISDPRGRHYTVSVTLLVKPVQYDEDALREFWDFVSEYGEEEARQLFLSLDYLANNRLPRITYYDQFPDRSEQ